MIHARVTPERLVLDTHVWKGALDGTKISTKVLRRIDLARTKGALFVAAITVWEIAMLVAEGKIKLNAPTLTWISDAVHASGVVVHPLEPVVSVDAAELPLFHGDPADRIIVATARHLSAILVTRDAKILEWAGVTKGVRVLEP